MFSLSSAAYIGAFFETWFHDGSTGITSFLQFSSLKHKALRVRAKFLYGKPRSFWELLSEKPLKYSGSKALKATCLSLPN